MSKTRVFIYGSCVSRDTFEHLDPEHFELVEYVARQSVLSAYTKPVELMAPPTLKSRFQQRMITGDFSSSLRSLLATHSSATDFVLVDLTDERLGAYMLPDGSFVTRSVELIESGGEQYLPQGTKHIAFGTQQHFDYWTTAMEYIGEQMRTRMPQATIVLLDIPWAEWSETGSQTPGSFGMQAPDANPVFQSYARMAARALGAHVISMEPSEVLSSPHHPWGDAPFHYAEKVYLEIVQRLTGAPGRTVWGTTDPARPSAPDSGMLATVGTAARQVSTGSNQTLTGADAIVECTIDKIALPTISGWVEVENPDGVVVSLRDASGSVVAEAKLTERRGDFKTRSVYKFEITAPTDVTYRDIARQDLTVWAAGRSNQQPVAPWAPVALAAEFLALPREMQEAVSIAIRYQLYQQGSRAAFLESVKRGDPTLAPLLRSDVTS
jgi:hypothetical protein